MKAIKVIDKKPELVDVPAPKGDGVRVRVVSSSICGSDLHMVRHGVHPAWREAMKNFFEGRPFGLHHGMFQPGAEDAQGHSHAGHADEPIFQDSRPELHRPSRNLMQIPRLTKPDMAFHFFQQI